MKLHFVFQRYGVEGLQYFIRQSRELALYFGSLVESDDRFEVFPKSFYSLVCFRIKNENLEKMNEINRELFCRLDVWERTALVGGSCAGHYFLRVSISHDTTREHLDEFWKKVLELSNDL